MSLFFNPPPSVCLMPKGKNKVLGQARLVQVPVPPFLLPLAASQEEKHLKGSRGRQRGCLLCLHSCRSSSCRFSDIQRGKRQDRLLHPGASYTHTHTETSTFPFKTRLQCIELVPECNPSSLNSPAGSCLGQGFSFPVA